MPKTIPSRDLRPGMYVQKLLGPWLKHPFWRTSFVVEEKDILLIQRSGIDEVVIDEERGVDVHHDAGAPPQPAAEAPADVPAEDARAAPGRTAAPAPDAPAIAAGERHTSLEAEIVRARRICLESRDVISAMFQDVRLGRAVNPEEAMPVVREVTASVLRNPSALISVARLKTADDYTYLHSVAVSALMTALAGQLGLDEDQTLEAAMGGLLHDMGKAHMPLEVLNKPGRLTDDEFRIMKAHPQAGHDLLRQGGVENAAVLDIALHHHEKFDGSGYPHGLAGEGISLLARMGAVCDVYDAITSDRPYKTAWDPAESLQKMMSWQGHFDLRVLKAFIRSLGIYPVGALVRLESGKLAVVVEQGTGSLLTPRVKAFFSTRSRVQIAMHEIDLAAAGCADRIVGVESPQQWGFRDLHKLWMP